MNWFNNLKIGKKLLIGYSIPSLIILFVGYFGFAGMSSIMKSLDEVYADRLVPIRDLGLTRYNVLQNQILSADLFDNSTSGLNESKIRQIRENNSEIDKLMDKYRSTYLIDDEKINLKKYDTDYSAYKGLQDDFFTLAQNQNLESAMKLYDSGYGKAIEAVRDDLTQLTKINTKQAEILNQNADESGSSAKTTLIILLVFGILVAITIALFISSAISKPLIELKAATQKMAEGDYNIKIENNSADEIGDLSKNFMKMTEIVAAQLQYLDNIPSPIMVVDKEFNIRYMNNFGASLGNKTPEQVVNTKCYDHFKTKDCRTENCACARAMRNNKLEYSETSAKPLNSEIPIAYTGAAVKDKNGKIIGAIEVVTDLTKAKEYENYLDKNSQKLMVEMNKFAEGDLTVEIIPEKEDDIIGKIFNQFNQVVKNIKAMIISLTDAVQATASASAQISSSAEEMAAGAQEQSTQTTEIAGAVEQMTKTILETSKNSASAAEQAKSAKEVAQDGGKSTEDTIEGMTRISQVVEQAANTIKELGKSSEKIGTIIEVIDDIADQTNLLALNAAIEAARAGEHGRGFAVVADEVRKLAERTTKATKEIGSMIKEIQKDTNGAVVAMESGTSEVEKGMALANESGNSLQEIINTTNGVLDVINQVAAASEEQSSAAEQISHSIEGINSVTQQSAAGVQEIARAAEDLNNLTVTLQRLIDQFKLENGNYGSLAVRDNGKLVKH
ncbi:MAG: hypothetical protein CO129_08830 [Ignavibacteriales bacterium CG_4_9_14_3_um_filter_34_10]|nr:MAG: hypothetical protein CO129_08830 [Ignavibacteriales bacterium CG_4_9_14_3_um_filter_34_10]